MVLLLLLLLLLLLHLVDVAVAVADAAAAAAAGVFELVEHDNMCEAIVEHAIARGHVGPIRTRLCTWHQVARCRHRGKLETCEDSLAINQFSSAVRGKSIAYRSAKRRNTSALKYLPDGRTTKSLPLYSEGSSRLKS